MTGIMKDKCPMIKNIYIYIRKIGFLQKIKFFVVIEEKQRIFFQESSYYCSSVMEGHLEVRQQGTPAEAESTITDPASYDVV